VPAGDPVALPARGRVEHLRLRDARFPQPQLLKQHVRLRLRRQWRISDRGCLGCSPGRGPVKRIGPSPCDSPAPATPSLVNILPLSYTLQLQPPPAVEPPTPGPRSTAAARSAARPEHGGRTAGRPEHCRRSQAARPAGARSPAADSPTRRLSSRRPPTRRCPTADHAVTGVRGMGARKACTEQL
jgi:hypothetical protein